MSLFDVVVRKKSVGKNARTRRLGFDALEGRQLLAVVPIVDWVETAPIEPVDTAITELTSEVVPAGDLVPTDPGITSYLQIPDDGSGGGNGGEGGEEHQPSPPFLFDFWWSSESGVYTFTGTVLDDQEPFLLTVYFGGAISGETCSVDFDGTFSFSIELENPYGLVTAMVQDADGLWSNQVTTYLF
jgi:hypothetical protein